ncbi:MAG: hypothetical protein K6F92_00970 [Lachnospiraceae bacterium]|nr:hypothetical protein [Lachnospiraceae bacterium]
MKDRIYCTDQRHGIHSFYLQTAEGSYYLFSQDFRQGVHRFYNRGVTLNEALDFYRAHGDNAIMKTMRKLPLYIKYVEKEFEIAVMEQTKRRGMRR